MFEFVLPYLNEYIVHPAQHLTEYIEEKYNSHINSSADNQTKLGLSNNGSLCWLNSSLKLLFLMTSDNDIHNLQSSILANPNSNISIISNIFCEMWEIYNYSTDSKYTSENKLNILKSQFIESLHQLISTDIAHNYGLEEIFKYSTNNNTKQDSNLFLMPIINILQLDNPQHSVTINGYITGFLHDVYPYEDIDICRKIPVGSSLIIHITPDIQCNSIDEYLKTQNQNIEGEYHWSNKELKEQGIILTECQNIKLPGKLLEKVEADINNLHSFVIYFSLNSLDSRSMSSQKQAIINIMFPQSITDNYINVTDYKHSNHKENINITPKAIICFTGSASNAHYICLTVENNMLFMHNDEKVTCVSENNNKQIDIAIKEFLINSCYTPYAILYQKLYEDAPNNMSE